MDLFERAKSKPGEGPEETLEGTIDRIVFSGGDGAFTVARLKVEKQTEVVTIVGSLLGVPAGAALRVHGRSTLTRARALGAAAGRC